VGRASASRFHDGEFAIGSASRFHDDAGIGSASRFHDDAGIGSASRFHDDAGIGSASRFHAGEPGGAGSASRLQAETCIRPKSGAGTFCGDKVKRLSSQCDVTYQKVLTLRTTT
jgi:hypothetical protein